MKELKDICLIIQARMGSERCPGKMLKPFAGTTLFDIALEKAERCMIPSENIFASVWEPELKAVAGNYDVQIFDRSEASAKSEGDPISGIFEWWDKLPGKYVVLINACCPMLTVETIDNFIHNYQNSANNGAFGVIEKHNYFWTSNRFTWGGNPHNYMSEGTLHNHSEPLIPPPGGVLNTKTAPMVLEAAHVLYAGLLGDIGRNVWVGDLATGKDITFCGIPEEECLDIDFPWQFEAWEQVYLGQITPVNDWINTHLCDFTDCSDDRHTANENRRLRELVDMWHDGHSQLPLHEYLGMTWYQYSRWVETANPFSPPEAPDDRELVAELGED